MRSCTTSTSVSTVELTRSRGCLTPLERGVHDGKDTPPGPASPRLSPRAREVRWGGGATSLRRLSPRMLWPGWRWVTSERSGGTRTAAFASSFPRRGATHLVAAHAGRPHALDARGREPRPRADSLAHRPGRHRGRGDGDLPTPARGPDEVHWFVAVGPSSPAGSRTARASMTRSRTTSRVRTPA